MSLFFGISQSAQSAPPLNGGTIAPTTIWVCDLPMWYPDSGYASTAAASGGTTGYTYQWQYSDNNSTWSDSTCFPYDGIDYQDCEMLMADRWYRRKVTDGASAVAYSNTVKTDFENSTPAPTASDKTTCVSSNQTLTVFSLAFGTIKWYAESSLETLLATGKNYNPSKSVAGTYHFYVVDDTGAGCLGYTDVTLTLNNC